MRRFLSSTKTFDNQSKLPRLPIPPLSNTLSSFLASAQLVLQQDQIAPLEALTKRFLDSGAGEKLQARLENYAQKQPYSWLERIWYDKAYLEWREPLMINSNWWLQFKDMGNTPKVPLNKGEFSNIQISRAAGLISNLLNFKRSLDTETFPAEVQGKAKVPVCMNQYKYQFATHRLPKLPKDEILNSFPSSAKHIIVLVQDQIHVMNVLSDDGGLVHIKELERNLKLILDNLATAEKQPPVGILTSEHRDQWAKCFAHLKSLSEANASNLELIQTSLFALSLEDFSVPEDEDSSHRIFFHGKRGTNRWFDAALNFIIANNGKGGCCGEHSPSDAVIPGKIVEECLKSEPAVDPLGVTDASLPEPRLLKWTLDSEIEAAVQQAQERAQKDIEDIDSVILNYTAYGANFLKQKANLSPDAFVQMVLQLAYFRLHGSFTPVYESSSTRQFLHGRTETIRSLSAESKAFCVAMEDEQSTPFEQFKLLQAAVKKHVQTSIQCSKGQGFDRHLLGLRVLLADTTATPVLEGEELQVAKDFFAHPAHAQSTQFLISSSNVSPPGLLYNGGFGPVYVNGYGVNYAIGEDRIKMSISSRRVSAETCSRSLRRSISMSMADIERLILANL